MMDKPLPIGTHTKYGEVSAIHFKNGERYYFLHDRCLECGKVTDKECECMNPSYDTNYNTFKNKFYRLKADLKSKIRMPAHSIFWSVLWKLKLAKPYSKFMCRRGWYQKFMDGRCMYCGNKH